jgi:hypothetical protein
MENLQNKKPENGARNAFSAFFCLKTNYIN